MGEKKKRKWPLIIAYVIGVLMVIFLIGPKPSKPDFSSLQLKTYSADLRALEDSLFKAEAVFPLKPDNQARIVWATPFQKTPYSMVYLHGNGASQEEGDPIHEALADRYGCNLFLARLVDHGLEGEDPLKDIDAVEWMQSALDAIAMGRAIGEKVILVSCSTGSTLALYLAAQHPELIEAHIMFSPNVDLFDSRSWLLTMPWGLHISRLILGSKYYGWKAPGAARKYWYTHYRIEGLVTLKSVLNATMTSETFNRFIDPVFVSYYYKDEEQQDHVVSAQETKGMFSLISTPAELKEEVALDDANTHIICSDLFNMNIVSLWNPVADYCENVLQLKPVKESDWRYFLDFR